MSRLSPYADSLREAGFFGVLAHGQSYLNIAYLMLSFPLGVFYFVFLMTGLSLGLGLAIIGIGLIILLAMLVGIWGLAGWERTLSGWLLGVDIPPPDPMPEPWRHPLVALKRYLKDSYTWKSLIYLFVKFPFGILALVIGLFLSITTIAFLLAPLLYQFVQFRIYNWHVVRAEHALLSLAAGLVLGLLSIHVMNGLAAIGRALAVALLSGTPAQPSQPKSGPVIIP